MININFQQAGCVFLVYLKLQQGFDTSQFATANENQNIVSGAGYSACPGGVEASKPAFQNITFTSDIDNMPRQDINYQPLSYWVLIGF